MSSTQSSCHHFTHLLVCEGQIKKFSVNQLVITLEILLLYSLKASKRLDDRLTKLKHSAYFFTVHDIEKEAELVKPQCQCHFKTLCPKTRVVNGTKVQKTRCCDLRSASVRLIDVGADILPPKSSKKTRKLNTRQTVQADTV